VSTLRRHPIRRLLFGTRDRIAGTVYGTIIAMATIAAGSAGAVEPWPLATLVVGTVVVLWIAHVYAHSLGESLARHEHLSRAEIASVARRELAIALAAVGPAAVLVLGGLGLFRDIVAVRLALAIGLVTLAVQGVRYARVGQLGRQGTVGAVAVNLALGITIVALEVLLAH
jgi:hypothetical protein